MRSPSNRLPSLIIVALLRHRSALTISPLSRSFFAFRCRGWPMLRTRITEMLGIAYPIVQAPMGWIARAQLASAVSNAGGLGVIETSSGRLDEVREEGKKMRALTQKPFGVNIAQAFVR